MFFYEIDEKVCQEISLRHLFQELSVQLPFGYSQLPLFETIVQVNFSILKRERDFAHVSDR